MTEARIYPGVGRLLIIRLGWAVLCLLTLIIFGISAPLFFGEMQEICDRGQCALFQLSAGDVTALQRIGFHLDFYAYYTTTLILTALAGTVLLSAVVLWKQPWNPMAIFASYAFLLFAPVFLNPMVVILADLQVNWGHVIQVIQALGIWFAIAFYYLFPDGRFRPRWSRWLAAALAVFALVMIFFSSTGEVLNFSGSDFQGMYLIFRGFVISGIITQIYRYQRISTPVEKQQTKWVVLGSAVFGVIPTFYSIWPYLFSELIQPGLYHFLYFIGGGTVNVLALFFYLGCFAIAIQRYHLWEIDFIIRKTLLYSLLTGALSIVYFSGVAISQAALDMDGEHPSPAVIVLITLSLAALFNPLRLRIQDFVDRRFYRQKYDAEKALVDFAAAARNETDLAQLSNHLMKTVRQALQPETITLWLKATKHPKTG